MPGRPSHAHARGVRDGQAEFAAAGGEVTLGGKCGAKTNDGGSCTHAAGENTGHLGVGRCSAHGGNGTYENAKGAYLMGHAIARGLNVTPWEALLTEVRRSAGEVAWLDGKVSECSSDEMLLLPVDQGGFAPWVKMREEARKHLARVAKMAIDGGVAEKLVMQVQSEAQELGQMVLRVLMNKDLALTEEQIAHARSILHREMLALAAGPANVIDGEVRSYDNVSDHQTTAEPT